MNNTPKGQIYDKLSVIITIIYLFLPCQRGKDVGRIIMESLQSRCNGRTKPCSRMNEFGQLIYLSIYLIYFVNKRRYWDAASTFFGRFFANRECLNRNLHLSRINY